MSMSHTELTTCPNCNNDQQFEMWDSVNVSVDPKLKQQLINRELTNQTCNECGQQIFVIYDLLYHDMDKRVLILLTENKEVIKDYSYFPSMFSQGYKYRTVETFNGLIEKIIIFDDGLSDYVVETIKLLFCMNNKIDIDCQFYYAGRNIIEEESVLSFELSLNKDEVERYTYTIEQYKTVEKEILPNIEPYIDNNYNEWQIVNMDCILKALEEAGVLKAFNNREALKIRVHILDPFGGINKTKISDLDELTDALEKEYEPYKVEYWLIGQDIDKDQAENYKDPETGELYIVSKYEKGKRIDMYVTKEKWQQAKNIISNS